VLANYKNLSVVREWQDIEPSFKPKTKPVWFDTDSLKNIVECWQQKNDYTGGIIWVGHTAVGAKLFGKKFFAHNGRNAYESIYDTKQRFVGVSIGALCEGFNLQRWHKNLILSCPTSGTVWEQLIGRTHRPGQEADTVEVYVLITQNIQRQNFEQAKSDAQYIQKITGQTQKLCYADYI
jgi:hypothetical protein